MSNERKSGQDVQSESLNFDKKELEKDLTFLQKIDPTNKKIMTQIITFILWIVGGIFVLYYILYESSKPDLIERGILPKDLSWVLYTGLAIIAGGIILLFAPLGENYYKKLVKKKKIKEDIKYIQNNLNSELDFDKAIETIQEDIKTVKRHNIRGKRSKDRIKNYKIALKQLLSKVRINRDIANLLQEANQAKQEDEIKNANKRLWSISTIINQYNRIVSEKNIEKYNNLIQEIKEIS